MAVPTIRLPRPLPHQLDFLRSPARHKVLVAGRKWGKSHACLVPIIDGHGPGGCLKGAAHGARGAWVAPTSEIASVIWDSLKQACVGAWAEKHEQPRKIVFPGGGSITLLTAHEPDSLRGPNYDFVVMDEAALLRADAWEQVLGPTLAAPPSGRPGWVIFISTPAGVENWFRKVYDEAVNRPGWARWQRPSSDNPVVTREFLAEKQATVSSYVWRQEYMAEFVSAAGGLFKREDSRHYWREDEDYVHEGGVLGTARSMQRFITCDTATSTKTSADHTAIAAWGVADRGELVLLDLYLRRVEGGEIWRQLERMCRPLDEGGWACMAFVEDNATSKHLLSLMREAGVPFRTVEPGSQNKWERAQDAVWLWENHRVMIPQRAEWLEAFERQVYNFEPKGSDDDSVDVLAYAARILRDEFTSQVDFMAGLSGARPKLYAPPGVSGGRPPGY